MEYNPNYNFSEIKEVPRERMGAIMKSVYLKMTGALALTAIVATMAESMGLIFSSGVYMFFFVAEIALVIGLTAALHKMSNSMATLLFYVYAAITGFTFAPIFMIYTDASIAKTFFITAGTFGAMSVYGYFTTRDLTSWGSFFFYALIGLIICSVVNMFMRSSGLDFIISIVGVLLFIGLTAWDTWKIKQWAEQAPSEAASKLSTIGALSLYLDFINLFLYLLRFFGRRD